MSIQVLRHSRPKARTEHSCHNCGTPIRPGEVYLYQAALGDDGFFSWRSCAPCDELFDVVCEQAYDRHEGIATDDYDEWAGEAVAHEEDADLRRQARAYLARRGILHLYTDRDGEPIQGPAEECAGQLALDGAVRP